MNCLNQEVDITARASGAAGAGPGFDWSDNPKQDRRQLYALVRFFAPTTAPPVMISVYEMNENSSLGHAEMNSRRILLIQNLFSGALHYL
jgi:hypothetical protein